MMEGTSPVVASDAREKILEITSRIVERFHPDSIILFGSHARGTAGPGSDLDLLVVMPVSGPKRDLVVDIRMAIGAIRLAKDVIVLTPEEFEGYRDVVGTIAHASDSEGQVLYRPPGVAEERRHAQQCAEKYLKAKLVSLALEFPRTHDIKELFDLLPFNVRPAVAEPLQERLTSYTVEARYPDEPPVDRAAAEQAVAIARQVREGIREGLPKEAL